MIDQAADPTFRTLLVQEALAQRGLYHGAIDNSEGPLTREAYQQFLDGMNAQPTVVEREPAKDASRTDWRQFKDVPLAKLEAVLPPQARPLAASFLKWGKTYSLHPLFLAAISEHETGKWTSNVFRTKKNAMGISDAKGAVMMPSLDESVRRAAYSLGRVNGLYSRCKTIYDVARVYAPVGAANDPTHVNGDWPSGVALYMSQLEEALA